MFSSLARPGFRRLRIFIILLCLPLPSFADLVWSVDGSFRLRAETINDTFRSEGGSDQIAVSRLLVAISARNDFGHAKLELIDSRSAFDDSGTPLGNDDVNTADVLQAYLGLHRDGFYGGTLDLDVGRYTLDLGSRRLVSRNRFRNTLNSFDGLRSLWRAEDSAVQFFYNYPVLRRPTDRDALDANRHQADRHYSGTRFWGVHAEHLLGQTRHEWYYYGLRERDQPNLATRNRHLDTVGWRMRNPSPFLGYEIEAVWRTGRSRASTSASEIVALDHKALFVHGELSHQHGDRLASKVAVLLDYASGDKSPDDEDNERFDTLFGSRGFDYGPTGIYGAWARANILSPGLRWTGQFSAYSSAQVTARAYWLASDRDTLAATGLRDSTGGSASKAGQELDVRLRRSLGDSVKLEFGGAYLHKSRFMRDTGDPGSQADSVYSYAQVTFVF